MSETVGFTKGPWFFQENQREQWEVRAEANGAVIADIEDGGHVDEESPTISYDEQQANARLIAAAPDMYEILMRLTNGLQDVLDRHNADDPDCHIPNDDLWLADRIHQARKALTKANGGGA